MRGIRSAAIGATAGLVSGAGVLRSTAELVTLLAVVVLGCILITIVCLTAIFGTAAHRRAAQMVLATLLTTPVDQGPRGPAADGRELTTPRVSTRKIAPRPKLNPAPIDIGPEPRQQHKAADPNTSSLRQ